MMSRLANQVMVASLTKRDMKQSALTLNIANTTVLTPAPRITRGRNGPMMNIPMFPIDAFMPIRKALWPRSSMAREKNG